MSSTRQKKKGWILPAEPVTEFELLCVALKIPDHPAYIAAFRGLLQELTKWWNWEKSGLPGDTRAVQAGHYWTELINQYLTFGECEPECPDCPCDECDDDCGCDGGCDDCEDC